MCTFSRRVSTNSFIKYIVSCLLVLVTWDISHTRAAPQIASTWRIPRIYGSENCHPIPPDMGLCQNIGYNQMVLPNFMDHEDIREAVQQSNLWVQLTKTRCHKDLGHFLCSLYAPVCLKGHQEMKIEPCYELCESVKLSCSPMMKVFGYTWPSSINCTSYPKQPALCISLTNKTEQETCKPCEKETSYENIISSYCMADVVVSTRVRKHTLTNGKLNLQLVNNKINIIKGNSDTTSNATLKGLDGLRYSLACNSCQPLESAASDDDKERWLIMGKKTSDPNAIDVVHLVKIDKSNGEVKRAMRTMRRGSEACRVVMPSALPPTPAPFYRAPTPKSRIPRGGGGARGSNADKESRRQKRKRRRENRRKDQVMSTVASANVGSANSQTSKPAKFKCPLGRKKDRKGRKKGDRKKNRKNRTPAEREKRRQRRQERKRKCRELRREWQKQQRRSA